MAISNYSEILTELGTMLARSDVNGRFDRALRLVETDVNRLEYKPIDMRDTTTLSTVAGSALVALPSNCLSIVSITYSDAKLSQVGLQQLTDSYALVSSGKPKVFASFTKRVIKVGPTADAVYSIDLLYNKEVPSLTSVATTNWLTNNYPGVYLYGTAYKIMLELRDAEQIAKYKDLYFEELNRINAQQSDEKYAREPMVQRINSGSIA